MMMSLKVNQATEDNFDRRIEAVRSFNRFYTKQTGALREGLVESRFSLAEVRVLYELARRDSPTATELSGELNLDAGYLSRILRSFEERGLISRTPSGIDGRQSHLCLTKKGQKEFAPLNARASDEIIRNFDPKRERCWIAEIDGENVGSVFLVKKSKMAAQLRLLLVDPKARGLGIGKRLVSECERFARQAGYRKIVLWTNSVLDAARHIYEEAGYRLIHEEPRHRFGHDLVGQTWELEL